MRTFSFVYCVLVLVFNACLTLRKSDGEEGKLTFRKSDGEEGKLDLWRAVAFVLSLLSLALSLTMLVITLKTD